MKNILIIAAHPDDEVLGCGGAIARHADAGDLVRVLIVAEGATSRQPLRNRSEMQTELSGLSQAAHHAASILGAHSVELLDFPDNRLDSIDRLTLIKNIEMQIYNYNPTTIYVHHSGDVNIDHRRVHEAVVTACRPTPNHPVKRLFSFEVPSSTEWQPPGSSLPFQPNYFMDISEQWLRKKKALEAYRCELASWPHSRSLQAIEALTRWRGAQVGVEAAEAFHVMRIIN